MIIKQLRTLSNAMRQEIKGRRHKQIHYVTDTANWSFKWDAHYITKGLEQRIQDSVPIITAPWQLRHQIILFGNRYPYFFGPRDQLHGSNELFLTWFHGDANSDDPNMQKLFAQLPHALDRIRKVIVSCIHSRQVLLSHGIASEKVVLIPLGVDLTCFTPPDNITRARIRAELEIPADAFCIGSFQKDGAGWDNGNEPKWIKGPDIFLEVMARIKGEHPKLMVLLTGPARGYVKQGLKRLNIPYRHRFLEEYQQIVACYQALDLYLIASRGEGGPKALMESWACGVPVVSTRMGMPADWILHQENGMLAEVDDTKGLADSVMEFMHNPDLSAHCRTGGLATVQDLSWQNIADQYFAILAEYLPQKS